MRLTNIIADKSNFSKETLDIGDLIYKTDGYDIVKIIKIKNVTRKVALSKKRKYKFWRELKSELKRVGEFTDSFNTRYKIDVSKSRINEYKNRLLLQIQKVDFEQVDALTVQKIFDLLQKDKKL
jgi:hypothetical protein